MDKILYLIMASAVFVMAAGSVLFISSGEILSVGAFSQTAQDTECRSQASGWEPGDPSVDPECVEYVDEEYREEAEEQVLASQLEDDIT